MFYHGHTPADLLKSTIVSIPKDNKKSLSGSDNYRLEVYPFLILSVNYLTILFYLNTVNSFNHLTCNLAIRRVFSTILCTLIYKEVIDQYINNVSTVTGIAVF